MNIPAQLEQRRMRLLLRGNIAGPKTRVAQNMRRKNRAIIRPNIASNNLGITYTPVRLGELALPRWVRLVRLA
jgi:hypothetical protein